MILDYYGILKVVKTLSTSHNLTLKFVDGDDESYRGPCTDGKVIMVDKPNPAWSADELTIWWYTIYHEIGHNVPEMRDCFDVLKEKQLGVGSLFHTMHNILEDYRQEVYKIDEFAGRYKVMTKGYALVSPTAIKKVIEYLEKEPSKELNTIATMMVQDVANRLDWNPLLSPHKASIEKVVTPEIRGYLDKMEALDIKGKINNVKTSMDNYDLVRYLMENVFDLDPDEEEEKARQKAKENVRGETEGEAEEKGGYDGEEGAGSKEGTIKYEDLLLHSHDGFKPSPFIVDKKGIIDYSTYEQYNTYIPASMDKITTVHYQRGETVDDKIIGRPDVDESQHWGTEQTWNPKLSMDHRGEKLSRDVRRLLQIKSTSHYTFGHKQGKVHSKNLYRATMRDAPEYSKRVFKRRHQSDVLDTAVTLMIDMSGSMQGSKIANAAQSAILLNDAISKIGIKTEIIGFTELIKGPCHFLFKTFDTQRVTEPKLREYLADGSRIMRHNADGESIMWAYNRIKQQKTRRKLMIVFSDGLPEGYRMCEGDLPQFTKDTVKAIEQSKDVEIYGIGIKSDSVREFYKEYKVIQQAGQLEAALFEVIKAKIL